MRSANRRTERDAREGQQPPGRGRYWRSIRIGRATALRLERDGYELALLDVDVAGLTETLRRVEERGGIAHVVRADLRDPDVVRFATREVAVNIGPPTLLVNVAGIGVAATILDTSDEDWDRVIAVNLSGPFYVTRAILPLMLDRGGGVVINVASVGGQVGLAQRAAYCASKLA